MTVGEVMRRQQLYVDNPRNPEGLFAVGKYQFVPGTLKETVNALGIDRNARFTPQLQEKMFADYLIDEKRPSVHAYITGKTSGAQGLERAQHALALEFASVGDPRNGGRSTYDGIAGNSASITPRKVQTALDHMREQYRKNVQSGLSADQAYKALSGDPNNYSQSAGATGQTQGKSGSLDDKLLIKGEEGPGVKRLQEALNAAGIKVNGQPLPTTGYFGDLTFAAVMQYQEQKKLDLVDGKAGKDTLTALGIYPGQQQTTARPAAPTTTGEQPSVTSTAPASTAAASTAPASIAPAPTGMLDAQEKAQAAMQAVTKDPLYGQAQQALRALPAGTFANETELNNTAGAFVYEARLLGVGAIAKIEPNSRGDGLIAYATHSDNPLQPRAYLELEPAKRQSLQEAGEKMIGDKLVQPGLAPTTPPAADNGHAHGHDHAAAPTARQDSPVLIAENTPERTAATVRIA